MTRNHVIALISEILSINREYITEESNLMLLFILSDYLDKKSKVEINTQLLTVGGGIMFITAGTLAITTRGDKPFIDNGTKWKLCPSEWAIIGGFTVVTFGVTFRF